MKLEKTTFDKLKIGDECIYMNNKGYVRHAIKMGIENVRFVDSGRIVITGQSHEVYKILDGKFVLL